MRDVLFLAGTDDVGEGAPDLTAALAGRPADAVCLLVAHDPEAHSSVPSDVGPTLCGHTHGGQVNVQGIGPIVEPSNDTQHLLRGCSRQSALGHVPRGLGVSLGPLRLNCPPELTLLDLTPAAG